MLLYPVLLAGCALCTLEAAGLPPGAGEVSQATFRSQLGAAQHLVETCLADGRACDSRTVPGDEQVRGEAPVPAAPVPAAPVPETPGPETPGPETPGPAAWVPDSARAELPRPGFHVSWQWLRSTLDTSAKASVTERQAAMQAARDHLEELGREAAAAPGAALARFPLAHAAAARVLAGGEFRADAGPTWLDRQIARAQDALLRFFSGMGRVGARNPWLAPLLEWLCFGLAAAGLLFFLRRNLRRQALRLSLGQTAAVDGAAAALNTDWIRKADSAKAAGDWREAIHCLYWAAIAGLETRRAWRPNATRTPREYPRLLRPGSEAQRALHSLTRRFERTWYGTADSVPAEVQAARGELAAAMATFSVGEFGSTASGAARRSPAPAEGAGS